MASNTVLARGQSRTIKIGYIGAQSGVGANFGETTPWTIERIQAAVKNGLNVGGKSYPVELVVKDNQSDPNRSGVVSSELVLREKCDLVLCFAADAALAMGELADTRGVPTISTMIPWTGWKFSRGANPDNLVEISFPGLALISLYDVVEGVTELRRCAGRGLKGALIWASPPEDRPYSSTGYDSFWAEAQELGIPISLHSITGMGAESRLAIRQPLDRYVRSAVLCDEVQRTLVVLIFSGVLERFPNLKLVSAENEVGWLPFFLQKLDQAQEEYRYLYPAPLTLKPSEYFRRQIFATFIDDAVGVHRVVIGLSSHRLDVAELACGHRAGFQERPGDRKADDRAGERGPALQAGPAISAAL